MSNPKILRQEVQRLNRPTPESPLDKVQYLKFVILSSQEQNDFIILYSIRILETKIFMGLLPEATNNEVGCEYYSC